MVIRRRNAFQIAAIAVAASSALISTSLAQTVWDSGGGTDTAWTTNTNWNTDTVPLNNGLDSLTIANTTANNVLTLGQNWNIGRMTIGSSSQPHTLNAGGGAFGLTLNTPGSNAANAAAINFAGNSSTNHVTLNVPITLAGSGSTYAFRHDVNNGIVVLNGAITGSNNVQFFGTTNGEFRLGSASNSVSEWRGGGWKAYANVVGAFGAAPLNYNTSGTTFGTMVEHFTTPLANSITLAATSSWTSINVSSRLTGSISQGANALTYTGGGLTRAEFSNANAGSGPTVVGAGALAVPSMDRLAGGRLDLATTGQGAFVLGSGDVPSWSNFAAVRTYNQTSAAAGTWRIHNNNTPSNTSNPWVAGGFAARGSDITIPAAGIDSLTNATFARNFILGSNVSVGGVRYADNAVKVQTDIAFPAGNYYIGAANNSGLVVGNATVPYTLVGPVHELNGVISGSAANIVLMQPAAGTNTSGTTTGTGAGIIRVTNSANSLSGSRWLVGSIARAAKTTLGGFATPAVGNMADYNGGILIFTSDAAFGDATEVEVASSASDVRGGRGLVLFEDVPGTGTAFTRNINVRTEQTAASVGAPGIGSYGGNVTYGGGSSTNYTSNVLLGGIGAGPSPTAVHVQAGALTLNGATFTNSRTATAGGAAVATVLTKGGLGTLNVLNASYNSTASGNTFNYNVLQGTVLYNDTSNDSFTDFDVAAGATLGGSGAFTVSGTASVNIAGILAPGNSAGTLDVAATSVDFASGSTYSVEIGGTTPGDGTGFYDQVNVAGRINLTGSVALNVSLIDGYTPTTGDTFYILTRSATGALTNTIGNAGTLGSGTGTFGGLAEGATLVLGGRDFQITYLANWTGTQLGSALTGGNDVALTVIPEPATLAAMFAVGGLVLARRRSR